jgi:hypothetical protein
MTSSASAHHRVCGGDVRTHLARAFPPRLTVVSAAHQTVLTIRDMRSIERNTFAFICRDGGQDLHVVF